jgi:hypothetical protein
MSDDQYSRAPCQNSKTAMKICIAPYTKQIDMAFEFQKHRRTTSQMD